MLCSEVQDLIEPVAAGDREPDDAFRAHVQTCVACAAAFASAQRLEGALKAMDLPPAPATFTAGVVQRIRRERWQSEQNVDRLFNLAIVAAVLLVAGGVLAIFNVRALLDLTASAWTLFRDGMRESMYNAAPTVTTYVTAAALLASAFGMWWWAERRLEF